MQINHDQPSGLKIPVSLHGWPDSKTISVPHPSTGFCFLYTSGSCVPVFLIATSVPVNRG